MILTELKRRGFLDKQLFSFNGIYCFLLKNSYSKCSNDVQAFFINIFYDKELIEKNKDNNKKNNEKNVKKNDKEEENFRKDILRYYLKLWTDQMTGNVNENIRILNNVLTRNYKSDFPRIFEAIKTNLANYKDEDEYKAKDKY